MKQFESSESQLLRAKVKIMYTYSSLALVCFTLFSVLHGHKMDLHSKKHSLQDTSRNGEGKWCWGKGKLPLFVFMNATSYSTFLTEQITYYI